MRSYSTFKNEYPSLFGLMYSGLKRFLGIAALVFPNRFLKYLLTAKKQKAPGNMPRAFLIRLDGDPDQI